MSASSNLDLVRSIYAAWERGDFSSTEWAHPEIELVIADGPSPGRWTGPGGIAEGWRGFLNAWEDFRVVVDGYRELDQERVLVVTRGTARGKTSGVAMESTQTRGGASLLHTRDGKVTKLVVYWDRDRADLGLAPEGDTS
jgi:ketosteroid isomerase-like protein